MKRSSLNWVQLRKATTEVVSKPWKKERFEVYLRFNDRPARITFGGRVASKLAEGNTNPLDWRLSEELPVEVEVNDEEGCIIEYWLSEVQELDSVGWFR